MRQPTCFGVGCFVFGFVARLLLRPSDDVQQFVGDGLLAAFVVLYSQLLQQFVGVVGGHLHGYCSGGLFGGIRVEQ